ncbi:aminotransferase class I/II-fold pyridoxal phosphate-dependent enzyme [Streptomyces sp. NPDC005355]|uniref:trans-sulfuration enzyme family protein n=1 Tax=Streptomyces sp. NPDC005355 TaxID=3157038 RepID=UPI0033ACAE1B
MPRSASPDTLAVHAGTYEDPTTGSVGTPIFQTSTFKLNDDSYSAFSDGALRDVPIYTRYGNPGQWAVQEKVAALEGGESAVVTASGMSAIASTVFTLTNKGSHIISGYDVYGGTYNLLREDMPSCGRDVTFVDPLNTDAIKNAIRPETQVLLFESLTNPLLKMPPIEAIAEIARSANALLVVDNTFLTPINMRPLSLGADLVVHSATKYIGGHSDVTAGFVVGRRKFLDKIWAQTLRFGATADPLCCFLLERGAKTLPLRVERQNRNSAAIADFLSRHDQVTRVHYPTVNDEVEASTCQGYGGVVSFEVAGGDDHAFEVMRNLRIPYVATSLGGVESLVSMPSNTSHSSLTARQKALIGINPGLIRMAVGIESVDELIEDLDQALGRDNGVRR